MKSGVEDVTAQMQAISTEMYAQAKQQPGAEAGAPPPPPPSGDAGSSEKPAEGDVIDADFTMVDDDKKK